MTAITLSQYNIRRIARAVIEFKRPFHIGSGREGETADAEVVRDANSLPAIPGSSLAGVLRSVFTAVHGDDRADSLFGCPHGRAAERSGSARSQGSRLMVSWGCLHNALGQPVEGLLPAGINSDPVLLCAILPSLRDHVRINHRGASDAMRDSAEHGGHGKFDELAVCAGHRFSFEIEFVSRNTDEDDNAWKQLLSQIDGIRLGGRTRRGFGATALITLSTASLDLSEPLDFEQYVEHPATLRKDAPALRPVSRPAQGARSNVLTWTARLVPRGYWMFGGGHDQETEADMAPVRDRRVVWKETDGQVRGEVQEDVLVIPGSSVKGAIAHRVAFWHNWLCDDRRADGKSNFEIEKWIGENNEAVRELFGCVKDDDSGHPGRIYIDDIFVEIAPESQLVHHVGIDRFTGGARPSVLFDEKPLWQGAELVLILTIANGGSVERKTRKALRCALDDLCRGRVQLGAGSGRGLGRFDGSGAWSDEGMWIGE